MYRTHLAMGVFFTLLFLPAVTHKWTFIIVALICTFLPDIDISQSYLGKYKVFRPLQWVVKHRGLFHSFTFAIIIALIFSFYFPILALPFFLGYSGHLIGDALTPEGIKPFWPSDKELKWKIKTNGKVEKILLYVVIFLDVLLALRFFI